MDKEVSIIPYLFAMLLIIMPNISESQTIKANVGKRNIYHDSGEVKGGQPTDGKDLYSIRFGKHGDFERLVLDIHEWKTDKNLALKESPPAAVPGLFWVAFEPYPFRLVFQVEGVRWKSATFPNFLESDYITAMYDIHPLDWGNQRFAITLNKPVKFEVFEMHNPARIVVDIKKGDKTTEDFPPVYSLRTISYNYDWEKLFDLEARLAPSNDFTARVVLKSSDNKLIIEEGIYKTNKESLEKQKIFAKESIILHIEKRKADEIPKVIKK